MAEREHSVVYRAVAQFDDARKKAKEFRDELKALKAEQEGFNKSNASSSQQAEQAQTKLTESVKKNAEETKASIRATREATEEVKKLGAETERTGQKFRSIQGFGKNFGNEFSKALGNLASDMRKAWRAADEGEGAFQKLRRAMAAAGGGGNTGNFFTVLAGGADSLGRSITGLLSKFTFWPTIVLAAAAAAGPLVAILGSLGAVALGAGSALISLSGVVAALPGVIFAAASGIGALVTAIAPLGNALKAYSAMQDAAGKSTKDTSKAQADQAQQIRRASRGVEQSHRAVTLASRNLEEAHFGVIRATRGVADAEYNLANANKAARRAQQDVNEARRDALKDLQDLRREVDRASLTEERAVLNLIRAQEELAKVEKDPTASALDRKEAALRLREAENDLADVRRENAENAQKLREEEAKGVEGSDKVVDAREREKEALKQQQDAAFALIEAQRGLVNANRQVSDAEYGLIEAKKNVIDAEQRLVDARKGTAASASTASAAQDKYREALEKLSPAGRKVLETLIDMKEAWGGVSKAVQEAVFTPVLGQLDNLKGMLPVVENLLVKAGEAIGEVAARGIKMVSSGPWKKDFADQAKSNATYIRNMGDAGLYLLDALRNITRASDPFTTWLTQALKQGAANFRDWSESARNNGTIERFLEVTKRRLQEVWAVTKNVGGTLLSWGKAAEPFTDWMMERLQVMTRRWREVAKAQESATSPLQKWLRDVRPLLTEISKLFGDIGRGLANTASDTSNIERAISLLESLRKDVLPAIARVLHELGESGVDQAIVDAIAGILNAIATFLEGGGGQALSTFVTVLAGFVEVLASIASLPGVSQIIGGIATALAAVAAVSIVARFTGLFKVVDAFRWFVMNRGNLTGALGDAARGLVGIGGAGGGAAAGAGGGAAVVGNVGAGAVDAQAGATTRAGNAAGEAATKTNIFQRSLNNVRTAATTAKNSLTNVGSYLLGPWGLALAAAGTAITLLASASAEYNGKIEALRVSLGSLGSEYNNLVKSGNEAAASTDEAIKGIVNSNPDLQNAVVTLNDLGISFDTFAAAAAGGGEDMATVLATLDKEIDRVGKRWQKNPLPWGEGDELSDRLAMLRQLRKSVVENGDAMKLAAEANDVMTAASKRSQEADAPFVNFIGPVSIQTRERLTAEYKANAEKINALQNFVTVLGNAESTATEKADAFRKAIEAQTGAAEQNNETIESWNGKLLDLEDAVKSNGRSLDLHSRAGLRNRDALEEAAKAARDLFLQDIASGKPMNEATKRHEERIKALKEEAKRLGLNKTETERLIKTYGGVPKNLTTDIKSDSKGFQQVYADLLQLQVMQQALKEGLSPDQAQKRWNQESSKLYRRPPAKGDGPGYAVGGHVRGPGSKTSDSIRAWLSDGEFVQPTDTVEHYGVGVMEAIRHRTLDKRVLQEALPSRSSGFSSGGLAHAQSCASCSATGSHKYATGGLVIPMVVNPKNTKIDQDWVNQGIGGDIGNGGGPGGWRWQMQVLRQRFPGLPLWSGYRPGSRTLSGNRSYHSLGRAVDLPPRRDVAEWIRENYGSKTKELITPYNDLNLHNGKPHRYRGAVWNQHNFRGGNAHDHWAFREGGLVDIANMFGFPGMDSSAMMSKQAMPNASGRQLSAAAQSVINQNRGITVENLNVNNPIPERASDSLSRQVTKLAVLGDI